MTFQELEQIRENYNRKRHDSIVKIIKIVLTVYLIIFAVISISTVVRTRETPIVAISIAFSSILPIIIHGIIIGSFISFIYTSLKTNKDYIAYKNAYKNYFITSTFEKVFTSLSYSHEMQMPYYTIAKTGMMRMGDRYSSNDYVRAKYKDIPFEQADVHIEEEHRDSDGDRTYSTVFRGRYITFELNKKFDKKVLVASKNFNAENFDRTFKIVRLESSEFNHRFSVYAQDNFEAFYLLDPAVMERIMKLDELHNGKIMVCFSDRKMHVAINDHTDSFEPAPAGKPIDEQAEFNKVINDIKVVTNIVDELKLVK